jgi:hypothetical protein
MAAEATSTDAARIRTDLNFPKRYQELLMKLNIVLAAVLGLGCALCGNAATYSVTTDALLNSTAGGTGVDFGLALMSGEFFTVSTDPSQIWHGAFLGDSNYTQLSTNADGDTGGFAPPVLNGIGSTPIGSLVASINGDYRVIGAGTHTFAAWGTGEILLHYADINNYDNSGSVVSTVSTPVPEPTSWALMMAGVGTMGVVARRRKAAPK